MKQMVRSWIAAVMAATSLVPVAASAQDEGPRGRGGWRGQQGDPGLYQQREGGVQPQREQVEQQPQLQPQRQDAPGGWGGDRGQRADRGGGDRGQRVDARPGGWNGQRADRQRADAQPGGWTRDRGQQDDDAAQARIQADAQARAQARGNPGGWTQQDRRDDRRDDGWRDRRRDDARRWNGDRGTPGGWSDRGQVQRQWDRSDADWRDHTRGDAGFADRSAWNRGWRNNDRYDWNGYRSANRGAYRMPRYYAPGGWGNGYRRFGIGVTLNQSLWGQDYWIDDPYDYRLPAAYGPYRWVRYYNDALLVDIRNGRIVDTVYDIFW